MNDKLNRPFTSYLHRGNAVRKATAMRTATPEEARHSFNNATHLVALLIEASYNFSFELPGKLKKSALWKSNGAYKAAALAVKREVRLLNSVFVNLMGPETVIDYLDDASDKFTEVIKADVQKLGFATAAYYNRRGAAEIALLAEVGTCTMLVAFFEKIFAMAVDVVYKRTGLRARPRMGLSRLLRALSTLEACIPESVDYMTRLDEDKDTRRGVAVISNRITALDNLMNLYDDGTETQA